MGDACLRRHDGCRKCRCRPKKWDEGDRNRTEVSLSSPKVGRGRQKPHRSVAVVPKSGTRATETAPKCRCRPKKWDEGDRNRTEVSLSSPKMGRGERMEGLTVAVGMPAFAGMTVAVEIPAFAGMTAWAIGRCGAWRILAAGSSSRLHRTGRQPSCWGRHPRNEGWSQSRNGRARPSARAPAPKWDPA